MSKIFCLILLVLVGCSDSKSEFAGLREGHSICQKTEDCACDGGTSSCREGVCYCEIQSTITETEVVTQTEVVYQDAGVRTITETITNTETITETEVITQTEVVYQDAGVRTVIETVEVEVEIPIGCETESDCSCESSEESSCREGLCYCSSTITETEVITEPSDCRNMTRAEFVEELMNTVFTLNGYAPPPSPTFSDVPVEHAVYLEIEAAHSAGIIDTGEEFRPNDLMIRAEAAKIMITAIDGLAGYNAPAVGTFDDVSSGVWYFDYVEAAVQLGLATGYVDSEGNLTGEFGPGNEADTCFVFTMLHKYNGPVNAVATNRFVTITNLGPSLDTGMSPGETGVQFMSFSVTSTVDMTARDTYLNFGVVWPPGLEDVNPLEYIENVRLVDEETLLTVAGLVTFTSDIVITDDYDFEANVPRRLSFVADISPDMPLGFGIQAGIRFSVSGQPAQSSYFFDYNRNEYIPTQEVSQAVNSVMTGALFTVN